MQKKITPDYLIELKKQFDLAVIIGETITLQPAGGGEYKGRCPFHNEQTSSFTVNASRFHCFGCHVHGDLFDWIIRTTGRTFPQAVASLAQGSVPITTSEVVTTRTVATSSAYDSVAALEIMELNACVQLYFKHGLDDLDHEALSYFEQRFGCSRDVLGEIGYAPNVRNGLCEYLDKRNSLELASKAGLISQSADGSWYDRLRDRITLPLCNRNGHIKGFAGRLIPRADNVGLPKYVNPPTTQAYKKDRHLFGLEHFQADKPSALLVEGHLDAISLRNLGVPNVMAICGSEFTRAQSDLLNAMCDRVVFMLDGDMPGLEATYKASKVAQGAKYAAFHLLLTNGQDPDEWSAANLELPFKALPRLENSVFFTKSIVVSDMKPEYDRSLLDSMSQPYVDDNIAKGWPHYNVVDWVMAAYPHHSQSIKTAALAMVKNTIALPDGRLGLQEEYVKAFLREWLKPSREVRKKHEEQAKKVKRF